MKTELTLLFEQAHRVGSSKTVSIVLDYARTVFITSLVVLSSCARSPLSTSIPQSSRSAAEAETSLLPPWPRIYFPFASDFILSEASLAIDKNIEWLLKNSDAYFILEGHCDKIGPNEFNIELGDRRARATKAYMLAHGIPNERIIMIVSYGSSRPLNTGNMIEDLRENRRVEFVIR